ncbi:penicillin-binding protein 2 [Pseudomonas aeruginosa]|nr:penicillin-binding protein 2 [Pseudomonas aeruginosa]VFT38796.1 penicillin-binding protein 2 [Pseudomonas aeruginosa]
MPNYDHKYRNWNRYGDGWVSLESAIYRSNDTYFYDLAHKLGIDRLHAFMSRFGFGQKVALDMFGEADGLMPSREWKRKTRRQVWYPGETLILGIGQGYMQATPIQLAQMTALLANKGHWIRPHLAKTIDGQPPVDPDPMPDIVLRDPANWDRVDYGMQQVVHGARGTARKVGATSAYLIAGKSGTAQVVAIKQNERYDRSKLLERHRDHALFVGFAPANNPQIAVAVMVENGESGSGVAAPVVKQVMDAWLLDEHGKLKAEYAEPVAPLAAAVAKPEPTAAEPEAPALEQ